MAAKFKSQRRQEICCVMVQCDFGSAALTKKDFSLRSK